MDNVKDDFYYIEKVISNVRFIIWHTQNLSKEDLESNEVLLDSILFRFIQISEEIKKLTSEFKSKYHTVPWRNIIGLRNRIVHEYGKIDLKIIYSVITIDIYEILAMIEGFTKE